MDIFLVSLKFGLKWPFLHQLDHITVQMGFTISKRIIGKQNIPFSEM